MFLNGLLSMLCSVIILKIEKPAQDTRLEKRDEMMDNMESLKKNITQKLMAIRTFHSANLVYR